MRTADWRPPNVDFVDPRSTPYAPIRSRGELPHLYKPGGTFFVTFRLRDAVLETPGAFRRLVAGSTDCPDFAERLTSASEPKLRAGSCLLRKITLGRVVEDALTFHHAERYQLISWCVMPNHVHATYATLDDWSPADIHKTWKGYTARRINEAVGVTGELWERETFDHLVRKTAHADYFAWYVENNPVLAGLVADPADWPLSSARFWDVPLLKG